MGKKVKCAECGYAMLFANPGEEHCAKNSDVFDAFRNYLVCGRTMRDKRIDHEQYCKQFCKPVPAFRNTLMLDGHAAAVREIEEYIRNREEKK